MSLSKIHPVDVGVFTYFEIGHIAAFLESGYESANVGLGQCPEMAEINNSFFGQASTQ